MSLSLSPRAKRIQRAGLLAGRRLSDDVARTLAAWDGSSATMAGMRLEIRAAAHVDGVAKHLRRSKDEADKDDLHAADLEDEDEDGEEDDTDPDADEDEDEDDTDKPKKRDPMAVVTLAQLGREWIEHEAAKKAAAAAAVPPVRRGPAIEPAPGRQFIGSIDPLLRAAFRR